MSLTIMKNTVFTLAGMLMLTGCAIFSNNSTTVQNIESKGQRDRIAYLHDIEAIDKKQTMYLTIPMNDQSYQPFRSVDDSYNRRLYPMWTDVQLAITDHTRMNAKGMSITNHQVTIATFNDMLLSSNHPVYSVEIPAVYRGTPDSRWNRRMNYTNYTSIAQFLYMNAEEDVFSSYNEGKEAWNNLINRRDVEGASIEDKILYAPRFFVIKIDCSAIDPEGEWAHSKNPNLQIVFNRTIADKRFEADPNAGIGECRIWTPIMPKWSSGPMMVNDFITGDLAEK